MKDVICNSSYPLALCNLILHVYVASCKGGHVMGLIMRKPHRKEAYVLLSAVCLVHCSGDAQCQVYSAVQQGKATELLRVECMVQCHEAALC